MLGYKSKLDSALPLLQKQTLWRWIYLIGLTTLLYPHPSSYFLVSLFLQTGCLSPLVFFQQTASIASNVVTMAFVTQLQKECKQTCLLNGWKCCFHEFHLLKANGSYFCTHTHTWDQAKLIYSLCTKWVCTNYSTICFSVRSFLLTYFYWLFWNIQSSHTKL